MNIPKQFDTPEFRLVWIEFNKMRVKIRRPMTDYAVKRMFNKLIIECGDDVNKAIASLHKSIDNSWQGVFPNGQQPTAQIKKDERVPKVYNGLDDAPIYTQEEISKHVADILRAIENKEVEDESIPF